MVHSIQKQWLQYNNILILYMHLKLSIYTYNFVWYVDDFDAVPSMELVSMNTNGRSWMLDWILKIIFMFISKMYSF